MTAEDDVSALRRLSGSAHPISVFYNSEAASATQRRDIDCILCHTILLNYSITRYCGTILLNIESVPYWKKKKKTPWALRSTPDNITAANDDDASSDWTTHQNKSVGAYVTASRGGSRILFWEGEGHWQGVWGTEIPQQSLPGGAPRSPKYIKRLKKHGEREKKTSPYRLTLYDNIISSSHPFLVLCFQPFCLKIQNAVCGLQSQASGRLATGSGTYMQSWWISAVQTAVFWHVGHRIRWWNTCNIGLIKRVSWRNITVVSVNL